MVFGSLHLSKNFGLRALPLALLFSSNVSYAHSINWEGKMEDHVESYMETFKDFREKVCVPRAEYIFDGLLKKYRGQGYWIPELESDVDVETIRDLLPEMEKKLLWIRQQMVLLKSAELPSASVTSKARNILTQLLALKKTELASNEPAKVKSRKESLRLLGELQRTYRELISKIAFLSNYNFPVDHLKNRKMHDMVREKEDPYSVKLANRAFLYRKIQEDGAYNKDHSGSDIYLRTTLDTLQFELEQHDFYLTEDARYDMEFVLTKIESELARGKNKILERLIEWEDRTDRTLKFYRSLTLPENQQEIMVGKIKTTPNRQLIAEHNKAAEELKDFVYKKQAEVYKYWISRPEILRAIFVLETILMNEVGAVDGDDALERMDVARVVMNRLDKPKYLLIGKKEFLYPHLGQVVTEANLKEERWLNVLFKQGEFSFTYYYMSGVAQIFCSDMAPRAKKLRTQNVEIALQVLKEGETHFRTTRYFSRASMIGRIHMDTIWEDYAPFPERPGLLSEGQEQLLNAFTSGDYTYLYAFKDHQDQLFQVVEIKGKNFALGEKNGLRLFYHHRNPHYFRYFTKTSRP